MIAKGFINCKVYSKFKPLKVYEGFVVFGGRVAYLGSEERVKSIIDRLGGELIDLKGCSVMPGFIDSHLHLSSLGESLRSLDLRGVRSIKDIKNLLKEYALRSTHSWLLGHGWDHELFEEGRLLNKYDLDEVVVDRPVVLFRVCLHLAVLNSRALELLKINERFSNSPNVLRDGNGVPTGVVREDVLGEIVKELRSDVDILIDDLRSAINHLLSNGITAAGFMNCHIADFYALQLIKLSQNLPLRVGVYLSSEYVDLMDRLKIVGGLGDEYLRLLGVKVFVDGSLGARTALLSEPYQDEPNTCGMQVTSEEELSRILQIATKLKLQVAMHSIGDKAVDISLKSYSSLSNVRGCRHRIEHMSLVRDDQLIQASELGIIAVVQPRFVVSDWWVVERVGLNRIKYVYPFNKINSKLVMGFSSDAPVEPVSPWETIYAAVTRGEYEGVPLSSYTKDESLSLVDALHAYTYGSAYALFLEGVVGTLEVGKYADFIVVDKDPLECDIREVRKIKVLETYVSGVKVYHI
ncbi:MAG: amidohydrolase [Sulfolobales archaeon]